MSGVADPMTDERRYDEGEVDEIFRLAAEISDGSPRGGGDGGRSGITLRELQEIGEQVGFSKALVARAAGALDRAPAQGGMIRQAGVPVGVDKTVPLSRTVTDLEWERLVARLRDTFGARGSVEVMGRLRQWSNGNLRVSVEPTESGYQLRLHTHKGNLRPFLAASGALVFAAVVVVVVGLLTARPVDMMGPIIMALGGLGIGGWNLLTLPGWAATRERQMEGIAQTVSEWTSLPSAEE